jgi:hypothetical protein
MHSNKAEEIRAHSFEYSQLDPRVIGAQEKWVACMKEQGYTTYKDTFDAGGDSRWNVPTASSQEIAVAVADWTCAKKVNLVGIWVAVESAYQEKQIDENAEQLQWEQENLRTQTQRISDILSGEIPAA